MMSSNLLASPGGGRAFAALLAFLAVCLSLSAPAHAQRRDPLLDYAIRRQAGIPTMTDQAVVALRDLGGLRREQAELSRRIDAAREAFFAAERAGGASAAQKAAFGRALFEKDYLYMSMVYLPSFGARGVSPAALTISLGGEVDDAIPPLAQAAFARWAEALREAGGQSIVAVMRDQPERAEAAVRKAAQAYAQYAWQRDLVEYHRAGVTPPGFDDGEWFVFMQIAAERFVEQDRYVTSLAGREDYALLDGPHRFAFARADAMAIADAEMEVAREVFGSRRVREAARRVARAPKAQTFYLKDAMAAAAPLAPTKDIFVPDAFWNQLPLEGNDRHWFVAAGRMDWAGRGDDPIAALLTGDADADLDLGPAARANRQYESLVGQYGEQAVGRAIEKVRASPMGFASEPGRRVRMGPSDAQAVGVAPLPQSRYLTGCVELLLQGRTYAAYMGARERELSEAERRMEARAVGGSIGDQLQIVERNIRYDGIRIAGFTGGQRELDWLLEIACKSHDPLGGVHKVSIANACFLLGQLASQGLIEGGAKEAVRWYERGMHFGDASCQAHLAVLLLLGLGVDADDPRRSPRNTLKMAREAAQKGSPTGYYLLALHAEKGLGTRPNPRVARQHYVRAAEDGHALARAWCEARNITIDPDAKMGRFMRGQVQGDGFVAPGSNR